MNAITKEELQDIEDTLSDRALLDDEELLHWLKKDARKLFAAYTAIMRNVTIRDGHEAEGAVVALVRATRKYAEWLRAGKGSILDGIALAGNVDAALARFEVDDTEPAA